MALPSPQANLPTFTTLADDLGSLNKPKRTHINPPRQVILTGGADLVFDARAGSSLGDVRPVANLAIQNLGANKAYFCMNGSANTIQGTYHGILAGGSAAFDGLGTVTNLTLSQPLYVTVKGTAGDVISVIVTYGLSTLEGN